MKDFWICHYCKTANFREQEGLDECERCGSETSVSFRAFEERMAVNWQREPKRAFTLAPTIEKKEGEK